MLPGFKIATLSPGLLQPSIAAATCRAGELGLLDFDYVRDYKSVGGAIHRFSSAFGLPFGIKLNGDTPGLLEHVLSDLPRPVATVLFTSTPIEDLRRYIPILRDNNIKTLVEAVCLDEGFLGQEAGCDGIVAKGHEAGGRIGEETTFILLQRLCAELSLPVWAQGGIGLH